MTIMLLREIEAIAATEFALSCPIVLMLTAASVGLGMYNYDQAALNQGVGVAAQYAYQTGSGVTAANIRALVASASGLKGTTVAVAGPACYCVTGITPSVQLTGTSPCGTICPDGATSSTFYVTIAASFPYRSPMPVFSSFTSATIVASATVQLQ